MIYYNVKEGQDFADEFVPEECDLAGAGPAKEWAASFVGRRLRKPKNDEEIPAEWENPSWDKEDRVRGNFRSWIKILYSRVRICRKVFLDAQAYKTGSFVTYRNSTPEIVTPAENAPEQTRKRLPSSMKELAALLAAPGKICKYDFGSKAIPRSGPGVTAVGARKAWKYVVAHAVARALVAREYGMEFTTADIASSCLEDWKTLSYFKHYSDALPDPGDPSGTIAVFIEKDVGPEAKYMSRFAGHPWCVASFITWLRNAKYTLYLPKEKERKKKETKE